MFRSIRNGIPFTLSTSPCPPAWTRHGGIALLDVEAQELQKLITPTAGTARDRPVLLRRLAEDNVELEYANEAAGDRANASAARQDAIRFYAELRLDSAYNRGDEVLYYLGFEYERAGDLANARGEYAALGSKFPQSPYRQCLPPGKP